MTNGHASECGFVPFLGSRPYNTYQILCGGLNKRRRERAVFLAQVPAQRYVASYEVLSHEGVGRNRAILDPLPAEGPGVSDLLLYRPVGFYEPDSLLHAAGMMLGGHGVTMGSELGVYWETYGSPVSTSVSIEIEVEREGRGVFGTITRLVQGGGPEGSGALTWIEPSSGPKSSNGIVLDLDDLEKGVYTLRLRTWWEGQDPLVRETALDVK